MKFCGAGSLPHEDDDPWSPSALRGPRRRQRTGGGNPYSARGREKFSMLLADLETRREKIVETAGGSRGVPIIQFVYSNSEDWVPVIVRRRERRPEGNPGKRSDNREKPPPRTTPRPAERVGAVAVPEQAVRKSFSWKLGEGEARWRKSYYWPAVVVLILLCLATFGRVFAIFFTSVWWYAVPGAKGGECRGVRRSMKKVYGRRVSDKSLGGRGSSEDGRGHGRGGGP